MDKKLFFKTIIEQTCKNWTAIDAISATIQSDESMREKYTKHLESIRSVEQARINAMLEKMNSVKDWD